MAKNVIFAPHVDDELLGCYSLLKDGKISDVFYFYELSDERVLEAIKASEKFGFTPHFELLIDEIKLFINDDDIIYVTSMHDLHTKHKHVNRLVKMHFPKNKKMFYSVDMNRKPKPLLAASKSKREALYDLYPSQHGLFNQSEKFWLFEDIHEDDSEKMIWVTFQRKGVHYYPEAGTEDNLKDVSYLGYPHRHLFKFKVCIEVTHANRDIEFHQFLNWIEDLYDDKILDLDHKSCEMMADDLSIEIMKKYSTDEATKLIIEVSEDGENGATCNYQI